MSAQRFLGWMLAGTIGLGGALIATPARAAEGDPPATLRVPGQPDDLASLTLVGASDDGVAVEQGGDPDDWPDDERRTYYTGAEGDELTARPAVVGSDFYTRALPLGVVGPTLGWAQEDVRAGERSPWRLHRLDVLTGDDVIDATTARPAAFTGDSWYTWASLLRFQQGEHLPLYRHHAGTGSGGENGEMAIDKLLDAAENTVDLAADSGSVLIALHLDAEYRLVLIDLGTGRLDLVATTTDVITSVALGPELIAWDSQTAGQDRKINSRPRDPAGPVTSWADPAVSSVDLVAGDAGVGYLVPSVDQVDQGDQGDQDTQADRVELRVVTGETARTVALPDRSSGLAAVGDRFLTAAPGTADVAGVYSVAPGDRAVRTATVPAAVYPVKAVALAGSALYTVDRSPADGHGSVWKTRLDGLTAERTKRFGWDTLPLSTYGFGDGGLIAFSAGRGLVAGPEAGQWQLTDRNKRTAVVDPEDITLWGLNPAVSGPYTLLGSRVLRPDGTVVYQVPQPESLSGYGNGDLFGSTLIWSTASVWDAARNEWVAQIWLDDVENSDPQRLVAMPGCDTDDPALVAVWGETVAWTSCDERSVTVRNTRDGQERTLVNAGPDDYVRLLGLQLSEGVLFVSGHLGRDDSAGRLFDLTRPDSPPVDLSGNWLDWSRADVDDHLIARSLDDRQGVEVQRLPFDADYRPRLIGKLAAANFTPGPDRVWRPRFDVTKPLVNVRLTLTDSAGTQVRALAGTSPDGSVRDLAWDGRDRQGRRVAAGLYRWTLTADAADGDGAIIGKKGGDVVSGQVRVRP